MWLSIRSNLTSLLKILLKFHLNFLSFLINEIIKDKDLSLALNPSSLSEHSSTERIRKKSGNFKRSRKNSKNLLLWSTFEITFTWKVTQRFSFIKSHFQVSINFIWYENVSILTNCHPIILTRLLRYLIGTDHPKAIFQIESNHHIFNFSINSSPRLLVPIDQFLQL